MLLPHSLLVFSQRNCHSYNLSLWRMAPQQCYVLILIWIPGMTSVYMYMAGKFGVFTQKLDILIKKCLFPAAFLLSDIS